MVCGKEDMVENSNKKRKLSYYCWQDRLFFVIDNVFLTLLLIAVLYPLIYVFSCSLSGGQALIEGKVKLFPVNFTLQAYRVILDYSPLWVGYLNSIIYTIIGTVISVSLVMLAAFPLTRKELVGRKIIMKIFLFTMIFNGGLIPTYLMVTSVLGLKNSMWSVILPTAISAYNVIIAKTFMENSIPGSLYEAASIDGCGYTRFFLSIIIPLSKPIIAVLTLWVAVGMWNAYFMPMLYIDDPSKMPLQVVLREILLMSEVDMSKVDPTLAAQQERLGLMMKYATIVMASLPLMMLYPFLQKYFVKGVMIGSVKG